MILLLKRPGGWIPLAMSLAALALVFIHLAMYGKDPQPDEGLAAHLFQLLMVGQLPIITFFGLRWVPRYSKEAIRVIALQAAAGIAAFAPIAVLGW
jgi:hypothetical protein